MYKHVFLFLCLAIACQAQIPFLGPCPYIYPKRDFYFQPFLGKWYEQEKYFGIFQAGGKCVKATYAATLIIGLIGVYNEQLDISTDIPSRTAGIATQIGPPYEARFKVLFTGAPFPAPYWVLETDYTSYAVVYSCVNFYAFHYKSVWLLSRARIPTPDVFINSYQVLDRRGIPRQFLQKTEQLNCPAYH